MTETMFKNLQIGDIIRPKGEVHAFVVTANYGTRVTAVRTADVTNPIEWDLMYKMDPKLVQGPN